MRKTQDFPLEIKEIAREEGVFTGLASVYGNVDLGGDVVEPGAFTATLKARKSQVPVLWQHDTREPIGLGDLQDSKDGLIIRGRLTLASPVAQKAYALLKDGVLRGLSIGFETIREDMRGSVRHLKELRLWEVSLVTFGMNEEALVSSVKAAGDGEVDRDELKQLFAKFKIQTKGFQV